MSKVVFDFNNSMTERVGEEHGVSKSEISGLGEQLKKAVEKLANKDWAFTKLPFDETLLKEVNELSESVLRKYKNMVVIGIGGSALGNRTLYSALPQGKKGKPVKIIDNVDPDMISDILGQMDFKHTIFNVITKSGNTAETMSNFAVFRKALIGKVGYKRHKDHIIVTTDPEKGTLRELANEEGYKSLSVPPDVGGRFSVLSSVGLLSAVFSGVDIKELLEGAKYMDGLCANEDIWSNPAAVSAALQYLFYKKGRNISVLMPYCSRLKDFSEWFSQLWAESLGKAADVGSTPVKTLGVTDQHSQLQLYMEGPQDKYFTFVEVREFDNIVPIPDEFKDYDKVSFLCGHTINELIAAEQKGTELALTKSRHPNCKISIDKINPFTVGAMIYMLEAQTAFAGELFKINTFNQPGVEESKQLTSAFLGRPGYEHKKEEIEKLAEWNKDYTVG